MPAKHQKITISIDRDFDAETRVEIAEDILEVIKKRTEAGKDRNGDRFPRYSEGYVKSLDFKIAGKSPGRVDLTLSADMLASMQLLSHSKGKLVLGFERGSDENARADGNIRGTYGRASPIPGKQRDFLGISEKELESILRFYR